MRAQLRCADVATDQRSTTLRFELEPAPGTVEPMAWSLEVLDPTLARAERSSIPAVPAAYVLACRLSQDVVVDEPLPPALHEGARHVGALLHAWYGWRPAELIAPLGEEPARRRAVRHRRPRHRGLFFTRGVDSWWSLVGLRSGRAADAPTHLITVDNEVHVPEAVRAATIEGTQEVADRLGLPLIVVRTDIRAAIDPHTDWGTDTHGSVLAGIGLALRGALDRVSISPTHWTPFLRPWGSHPELDSHWSIPGMEVRYLPGTAPRWQRIAAIADDPVVRESLLVCWQGTSHRNCGTCAKCLRLRTSLELLGVSAAFEERFDEPFDPSRISELDGVFPHPWCETLDHCDAVGLDGDELRQRWEVVPRRGIEGWRYEDRPVQPRLPVVGPTDLLERLGKVLARLGARIDHGGGRGPIEGPHLLLRPGAPPTITVALGSDGEGIADAAHPAMALPELRAAHLVPLLEALGHRSDDLVPFAPDGQAPPPQAVAPDEHG